MKRYLILIIFLLLALPSYGAWTEKFVATVGGGDGSSSYTVTAAVADGVWTASSKTLHHDGSFSTALGTATEYLYISSATAGTAGLYTIASITSADEAILGTLVSGAGIAADQTDVVCGTGPWTMEEAIAAVAVSNRVNIKAGSYPNMGADYAFATAGATTTPIWWRGYKLSIGDKDTAGGTRVAGTDIPLWNADTATDQVTTAGAHQIFSNIALTSICTDSGGAWSTTGGNITILRCQIVNTAANANSRALTMATATPNYVIGCYLSATTTATYVVVTSISSCVFYGNSIRGGVNGLYSSALTYAFFNVIDNPGAGIGIKMDTSAILVGNTIYGAGTDGIYLTAVGANGTFIANNIISTSGGIGINQPTGADTNITRIFANDFYSNVTNPINGFTEQADDLTGDLNASMLHKTESSDPLTNAVGHDFSLVSSANGKAGAFPGVFENESYIGYMDAGAVQRMEPASTGGGNNFISLILRSKIAPFGIVLCGLIVVGQRWRKNA